jgi:hypothetical protein
MRFGNLYRPLAVLRYQDVISLVCEGRPDQLAYGLFVFNVEDGLLFGLDINQIDLTFTPGKALVKAVSVPALCLLGV